MPMEFPVMFFSGFTIFHWLPNSSGISLYEWERYSTQLIQELGETRCRVAAERVLGSRKAESRRKVKHAAWPVGEVNPVEGAPGRGRRWGEVKGVSRQAGRMKI